jgi:hypothetical protein
MARDLPHATRTHANPRLTSNVVSRDVFYSKLFTRLSIAVFLTMAASVVATAVLYNQGF